MRGLPQIRQKHAADSNASSIAFMPMIITGVVGLLAAILGSVATPLVNHFLISPQDEADKIDWMLRLDARRVLSLHREALNVRATLIGNEPSLSNYSYEILDIMPKINLSEKYGSFGSGIEANEIKDAVADLVLLDDLIYRYQQSKESFEALLLVDSTILGNEARWNRRLNLAKQMYGSFFRFTVAIIDHSAYVSVNLDNASRRENDRAIHYPFSMSFASIDMSIANSATSRMFGLSRAYLIQENIDSVTVEFLNSDSASAFVTTNGVKKYCSSVRTPFKVY